MIRKRSRPVRRGVVGKVLRSRSNSLAIYSTAGSLRCLKKFILALKAGVLNLLQITCASKRVIGALTQTPTR
jgi:hypothetical protein